MTITTIWQLITLNT